MKNNVGSTDKIFRSVLAIILIFFGLTGGVPDTGDVILLGAGGVLLATSLLSHCPIYSIFGIETK